jgi:hypothetical protein
LYLKQYCEFSKQEVENQLQQEKTENEEKQNSMQE